MKKIIVSVSLFALSACGAVAEPESAKLEASTANVTAKADAAAPGASPVSSATRHLPGTIITTATGKYYYLVKSDGTIAAFASPTIVTSSGYRLSQAVTTTAEELRCYGRAEDIVTAMPVPSTMILRDGTLVKEEGRSAVYAVSDSVAWPILNGDAYKLAGYSDANVQTVPLGSLAAKVEAIGDCATGIACLDLEYQLSCAKEEVPDLTATATDTSTSLATDEEIVLTQKAASGVLRHLPGTVIASGSGKYYLVNADGSISQFASASLVRASGYSDNMVIAVSQAEINCYSPGSLISARLPAPAAGKARDGAIVKDENPEIHDTYIVSGGIAWPVITGKVFEAAGYTFGATDFYETAALRKAVSSIGNCATGVNCLTAEYGKECGSASDTETETETETATNTKTNTSTATLSSTGTATSTITAVTVTEPVTQTQTQTQTASATSTLTQTASSDQTSTATSTGTSSSTATITSTVSAPGPGVPDLSWVYDDQGARLCFNAAYFAGGERAVLLVWNGPGADKDKGLVAVSQAGAFCWNFANREKGLYYFWPDAPDPSCSAETCARDSVSGNGGMYMTAPKASAAARKWLHCEPTGCDGVGYWDGYAWTPMGD